MMRAALQPAQCHSAARRSTTGWAQDRSTAPAPAAVASRARPEVSLAAARQGHRLESLRIAPPAVPGLTAAAAPHSATSRTVLQPLLSAEHLSGRLRALDRDPHLQGVHRLVAQYHQQGQRTGRERQADLLHISNQVQTWLAAGNIGSHNRDAALDLLDNVQADYHTEIGHVLTGGEELHVAANRGRDEPDDAPQLWTDLVGGARGLRVTEEDPADPRSTVANFRRNTLAELARLIQTPSGRKLVRKTLAGPRPTTVAPLTEHGRGTLNALRAQLGADDAHGGMSPAITMADLRTVRSLPEARQRFAAARQNVDALGSPLTTHTEHGVPVGTSSIVALESGLRDSSVFGHTREGTPLVTPLFLTLQHELNHAKRITRGRSRGGARFLPNAGFPNLEEAYAISASHSSENTERAARQLGRRYGHSGLLREELPEAAPPPPRQPSFLERHWRTLAGGAALIAGGALAYRNREALGGLFGRLWRR